MLLAQQISLWSLIIMSVQWWRRMEIEIGWLTAYPQFSTSPSWSRGGGACIIVDGDEGECDDHDDSKARGWVWTGAGAGAWGNTTGTVLHHPVNMITSVIFFLLSSISSILRLLHSSSLSLYPCCDPQEHHTITSILVVLLPLLLLVVHLILIMKISIKITISIISISITITISWQESFVSCSLASSLTSQHQIQYLDVSTFRQVFWETITLLKMRRGAAGAGGIWCW